MLALERGLPLVTTETGAKGLCPDKSCPRAQPRFGIAENASQFIALTCRAVSDSKFWRELSTRGYLHSKKILSLYQGAKDIDRAMAAMNLFDRKEDKRISVNNKIE